MRGDPGHPGDFYPLVGGGGKGKRKKTVTLKSKGGIELTKESWTALDGNFKTYLLALFVFSLGASTDAFILLRFSDIGLPMAWVGLLWSLHHVVKMVATYYGGKLSDRLGPRRLVWVGWFYYAAIYLAFSLVQSIPLMIFIFLAYGLYYGLTEPSELAWVGEMVPAKIRGTAFGYYNGITGLGYLPASLLFGWVYGAWGAPRAFQMGALLAGLASLLLLWVKSPKGRKVQPLHIMKEEE